MRSWISAFRAPRRHATAQRGMSILSPESARRRRRIDHRGPRQSLAGARTSAANARTAGERSHKRTARNIASATIDFQAPGMIRGGRRMPQPRQMGRRSHRGGEKRADMTIGTGLFDPYQAQPSTRTSNAPRGANGAAGCPLHHAPWQRPGRGGLERGSGRPDSPSALWASMPCMKEGSLARSARDVTCWEHPARAATGAIATISSDTRAAADRETRCGRSMRHFIRLIRYSRFTSLFAVPAWGQASRRTRCPVRAGAGRHRKSWS